MARIIIVDDDELVTDIVVEALRAAGHMISAIHDSDDVSGAICASAPDLLILDYNLPGKSGLEILREIRRLRDALDMPVLMLTARGGPLLKSRAYLDGIDDYVVKPFKTENLLQRVEALLRGRSSSNP